MIFPDTKKAAGMILASIKPEGQISSGGSKKPEAATKPSDESLRLIAEDMLQAFHEKSANGIASALKAFCAQNDLDEPEQE